MNIFGAVNNWNEARKTRRELSALTNRQLEDIGIPRYNIEAAVKRQLKG